MRTENFPVGGPIEVDVRIGFGLLRIESDAQVSEAVVELSARSDGSDVADRAEVRFESGRLSVHLPRGRVGLFEAPLLAGRWQQHDALEVTVRVPAGSSLKAVTHGAEIQHVGRLARADVGWGAAGVVLDEISGTARLRWGSGSVAIARAESVQLKGGAGDVSIGSATGDVVMACGTGQLRVDEARGRVQLRSGSGGLTVAAAGGDVDVTTGSGEVSVGVPTGVVARLDVVVAGGQLHSDMPVEAVAPSGARPITVRVRSGHGDVRLHRTGLADAA